MRLSGLGALSFQTRLSLILLIIISFYNLIAYSGNWGGDPEIHIIFAKNFLNGHFLEFNPGFRTSGETSPFYMLLVALGISFVSVEYVWILMSIISLFALFGIFVISMRASKKYFISLLVCLYITTIPSIFFQTFLGMENIIFSLFSVFIASKLISYDEKIVSPTLFEVFAILLMALIAFYLRPETVILLMGTLLFFLTRRDFKRFFIVLIALFITIISLFLIEYVLEAPIHGAGSMRSELSSNTSNVIKISSGELRINTKFLYYFIIAAPFLIIVFISKLGKMGFKGITQKFSSVDAFFIFMICIPLILHMFNFFPNNHFSRYQLYFFFLTAFYGIYILRDFKMHETSLALLFCIFALVNWSWETKARDVGFERALTMERFKSIKSRFDNNRKKVISEFFCENTGLCKEGKKTTIAATEVQIRMYLDDRFFVASLDGITDYYLKDFIDEKGCYKYFDYFEFRQVDIILEFPNSEPRDTVCEQSLMTVFKALTRNEIFKTDRFKISPRRIPINLNEQTGDFLHNGFGGLFGVLDYRQ